MLGVPNSATIDLIHRRTSCSNIIEVNKTKNIGVLIVSDYIRTEYTSKAKRFIYGKKIKM